MECNYCLLRIVPVDDATTANFRAYPSSHEAGALDPERRVECRSHSPDTPKVKLLAAGRVVSHEQVATLIRVAYLKIFAFALWRMAVS
jgi:hypothetical protein